jgi:hypothetical protein
MSQSSSSSCHFTPWSSEVWLTSKLLPCNPTVYCLIAAILAISYWLVIELTCEVYFTFKRHDSLYFWSIVVSIWGVALRAIGWTVQNWIPGLDPYIWITLLLFGGTAMVTGFSFVLYSRLHLVIRNQRILNIVLGLICVDAVAFLVPLAVASYGLVSDDPMKYLSLLLPADRLYVNGYFVQEAILVCLYIWTAKATILHSYISKKRKATMILIGTQVIVVCLDIPLLVLAWMDLSRNGATLVVLGVCHPTIYAVKLKIEFIVLNQLKALVKRDHNVNHQQAFRNLSG